VESALRLDIDDMMQWGGIKPGAHLAGEMGFNFYGDQIDVKFESRMGEPWESWLRLKYAMADYWTGEEVLKVKAQAYVVEAGNVRHEHEWRVWKNTKLPQGKILIPGVVSHATNVLEHPELVADRLVRFAKVVGRENVLAGTDCGLGGRVHPQIAWAKLTALSEGAKLATKELWS